MTRMFRGERTVVKRKVNSHWRGGEWGYTDYVI